MVKKVQLESIQGFISLNTEGFHNDLNYSGNNLNGEHQRTMKGFQDWVEKFEALVNWRQDTYCLCFNIFKT